MSGGMGNHGGEGRVERRLAAKQGDLTDTVPLAPAHDPGEAAHAHPGARGKELGGQKAVSAPPITLRCYIDVNGCKTALR